METSLDTILLGVPEPIANMHLPDPDLRDYYKYESRRVFWLNDNVENCAEALIRMILNCNADDKNTPIEKRIPIKLFIDSNGGDMTAMWTIINLIKHSKTKVITINYCTAYSAAAEILASGHERYALPGTNVMVHSGSCAYSGQADQVESTKKYFDALSKKTTKQLLDSTKMNPKTFKVKSKVDWFMDEEEALKNGIIDKIVEDLDEIL